MSTDPRGRPPLSEERRREQRLAVSRAAVALFREHGLSTTSGQQVAAAAGISERTLWRLFRSKESCVEPVLRSVVDGTRDALRSWSASTALDEHLGAVAEELFDADDTEDALAVIRMSHESPPLRAVWLLLQEQTEPALREALAGPMGLPPDAPAVYVRAATTNAALRVLVDAVAAGGTSYELDEVVAAVRDATRPPPAPSDR
ncbi:TetR family transcriptional regulator [Marmoricola endophyticus]|uniref:TetR family transcriptional regulator n=1 Tax=Marmoricola endophyticus TaxID=2040280 RepID=A0A917BKI1_9ACTN|nr:TetR/AcrR family transcriptional regulator [Marmoricola endophyticus]GGF46600.1 TetR family transcriptional regulator [Marmoricola endophyticus]